MQKCPKCNHVFKKQTKVSASLEDVKDIGRIFRERQNVKSVAIILNTLKEIKNNSGFGLTADQFVECINELNGFRKDTIDIIADYCQYRQKEIGSKHVNYFRQIARSKAGDPKVLYKTDKMKAS